MNSSIVSTILSSGMLWTAVCMRGQFSSKRERLLWGRNFIQLSELFIEVENELLSGTFPGFVQDSSGDIGV